MNRISIISIILLAPTLLYGQKNRTLGRKVAEQELKSALYGKSVNVIDGKEIIIKDSLTAIAVVEPILFNIYGKEKIVKERPYETYLINNYWVISGSLPSQYDNGGAFLVIIDARNSQIIKLIHFK